MSSTIELPYNEPLYFNQKKNVFKHRITIQWTFTFPTKKCFQPSNYHTMNLYLSNKKCLQPSNYHTMKLYLSNKKMFQPSNYHTMKLYLSNKKMSSTTELPYNEPLSFNQKKVFDHRFTIQWTFNFRTKKRLQPSNYHKRNLYFSNKNMSSNIELPYNETLPLKQKNVFNHQITIQWTFTFKTKKCLQSSNCHTMNLYISNKKMSSTIKLPYNEPLPLKKKCHQPSNYHTMNLYLSNKKMFSTIELPYNEPLPLKEKYVFNHRITIQWTFNFQTKKWLQPSNYHTRSLYLSNKKMSSTIELPSNEPLYFK